MAGYSVYLGSIPVRTAKNVRLPSLSKRVCYGSRARRYSHVVGNQPEDARKGDLMKVREEERILVTGISCRLPSVNTMEEFQGKLLAQIDMVSQQSRWNTKRLPPRFGFVTDFDRFDAEFFGVVPKLANCMDPQQRKLLEVAFEAVIDAGLNPADLRGTRTSVYVGALGGEATECNILNGLSENYLQLQVMAVPGFMLANRISFALDLRGASQHVSSGCSSGLVALEEAVNAIQKGTCDAAIVAASSIILSPDNSHGLVLMNALAPDGACKTFDDAADGYVRSEGVVAVLIQKESDAKRHYATISHVESNSDGYKDEGIMFPSGKGQEALLRSAYAKARIDPASVTYIETHGTGTPVGDPQEVNAIYNVFCRDVQRQSPLILGSVKTNIGHTEYAAGLSGLAKVITCIQTGVIPANLHFRKHNRTFNNLFGSAMEVASEPKEWKGGFIGVSAFGLGGSNSHLILEPGPTEARPEQSVSAAATDIPVIFPFSGRTRQAVHHGIHRGAELGAQNAAVFSLLQNAFRKTIPGHAHKGFGIVSPRCDGKAEIIEVETLNSQEKRPLWYVFPGVGSQWPQMGKKLMKFQVFAQSMMKSSETLSLTGLDLNEILSSATSSGGSMYTNIRHALVAIAAVQIGLYDLLASTGLQPDGYLGHSGGEALCAYADGCLSREETILVSDAIGRAILDGVSEEGSMASVGLTLEEAKARCPPGISISCHNGRANVVISGSPTDVQNFVQILQCEGVFAQEVKSCGTAVHNRYYGGNAPELMEKYMKEICREPHLRSSKWISTSVPEEDWRINSIAQYCSAAYFANNLLQPVLFHEATQHIPSNAVVVEVAPSGQFQGWLQESLTDSCHVAPMSSSASDKVTFFLRSIGKLHNSGLDVDLRPLYPGRSSYPVPANVPCLSPLVRWNHEEIWSTSIVTYPKRHGRTTLLLDLDEPGLSYLRGHRLGNKIVFPATGYLTLAWKGLAEDSGQSMEDFPVYFENVTFERVTVLRPDATRCTKLRFSMLDGEGSFVIRDGETAAVVASGKVKPATALHTSYSVKHEERSDTEAMEFLEKSEAYKELRLRGYRFGGSFQNIERISIDGSNAMVKWTKNWTTFLDAVFQTILFSIQTRNTLVASNIERLTINPQELLAFISEEVGKEHVLPVIYERNLQRVTCPGVTAYGILSTVIPVSRQRGPLVYERHTFCPFVSKRAGGEPLKDVIWKVTDVVRENAATDKISAVEIAPNPEDTIADLLFQGLDKTWRNWTPELTIITLSCNAKRVSEEISSHLPVQIKTTDCESRLLEDVCANLMVLHEAFRLEEALIKARDGDFILCLQRHHHHHQEDNQVDVDNGKASLRRIMSLLGNDGKNYTLYRKMDHCRDSGIIHIPIDSRSFSWVPHVQSAMQQKTADTALRNRRRIYLTSQSDPNCGVMGLIKCLRREVHGDTLRAIFDPESLLGSTNFQRPGERLLEIVANDLVTTVLKGGQVGSYCHLPVSHPPGYLLKSVEHAFVNQTRTGDFGSLHWIESPNGHKTFAHTAANDRDRTTFCRVTYASMNFRDVMVASGKLPVDSSLSTQDCHLGCEFSGEDYYSPGKRLMGYVSSKALATSVLANNDFVFPVPDSWSLEDAATVPVAYYTAYWALLHKGRLSPGQSVLVHCGTGGLGQAAIYVALAHNCEVFTTVGSDEKRQYIKERFPELRDDHIGNSRDCSFENQFRQVTAGRGLDIVLNSLTGDQLEASVRCLAIDGKFLEVGSWHAFTKSARVGMSSLRYAEFHGASAWKIFERISDVEKRSLRENFLRGLESGVVKPLPRTVFKADEIEEAFRFMASRKHVGKVLINVRENEGGKGGCINVDGGSKTIRALARTYFQPEKTYVVIGGLGGLGLEVANWLVDRGARHLVLPSRSGVSSSYQRMYLQRWRAKDAIVEAPRIDLSNLTDAERFVKSMERSGRPMGGVFNSTLVLRDNLMSDQTVEDFEAVAAPKILITKHMDTLTRTHCSKLDYFVTFSSAASCLGYAGQSNYAYANSAMERICERRVADGLPGLAIQWGAISDVGFFEKRFFFANNSVEHSEERILGLRPQSVHSCLEVLDNALQQQDSHPVVVSILLVEKEEEGGGTRKNLGSSRLLGLVSKIFGVKDIDRLTTSTKLSELGMDSLIAAEFRQILERDFDFPVTVAEMRSMTIADLRRIEAASSLAQSTVMPKPKETSTSKLDQRQQPSQPSTLFWNFASLFKLHNELVVKLGPNISRGSDNIPPLYVVHGVFGDMRAAFEPLATKLNCDTYIFQFGRYSEADDIRDLAKAYVRELRMLQTKGTYNICGYSAGGVVAFEMAQILQKEHKAKVSNLIFLDGTCDWRTEGKDDTKSIVRSLLAILEFFTDIPAERKEEFLQSLDREVGDVIGRAASDFARLCGSPNYAEYDTARDLKQRIEIYLRHHVRSFTYSPSSIFYGRATLIRAEVNQFINYDARSVQKHCRSPVTYHTVSGNHSSFLSANYVGQTAEILNRVLPLE